MGFFKDFFSKKDGSYKTYYSNGNLREERSYTSGKKDGHWRVFDENGVLTSLQIYSFGRLIESTKNRDLLDSYQQGQLEMENLLNEEVELIDPLGRPEDSLQPKTPQTKNKPVEQKGNEKIKTYHEGNRFVLKKGDLEKVWGQPEQEVEIVDSIEELEKEDSESGEGNILQDVTRMKNVLEKGTGSPVEVKEEFGLTTFLFDKEDKKKKTSIEPIREGSEEDLYWGQKDDGIHTLTVYKDGKLNQIWEHQDLETLKKREGFYQLFYTNGVLKRKGNLRDGELDGLNENFHENGQLFWRGNYKDRKEDGLFEVFYENGEQQLRGNYKNGKKDGLFEVFDENGNLTKIEKYKDGELIN
tara:strand:- start:51 stop:1118 length:1068 start_codon:yes stop_codon:yes gene_type:complete